jgi:hypothetical protein
MDSTSLVAPAGERGQPTGIITSQRAVAPDVQLNFDFEASLPASWRGLMNGRGQIVWSFDHTLIVKLIGLERALKVHKLFSKSWTKVLLYSWVYITCTTLLYLGMFKLVPDGCLIFGAVGNVIWLSFSMAFIVDTRIATRILLSFANGVNVFFSVLQGVSYGFIFNWDLRAPLMICALISGTSTLALQEAMPVRVRKLALVPANASLMAMFIFMLIAMNLGMFPDADFSVSLLVVTIPNHPPVAISALGTFTQASSASIVALARNLWVFGSALRRHHSTQLPSAPIFLDGVDDPESDPSTVFSSLSFLDGYV